MNNLTYHPSKIPMSLMLRVSFALVMLLANKLYAQETRFFMPLEIKQAYETGTRSFDGEPGKGYWQNTADYKIAVTIIPEKHLISGSEEVVYHNTSPNDINELVVRIYADVYKKGSARLMEVDEKKLHDGVELNDVQINGKTYTLEDNKLVSRYGTNISFTLEEPLKPGSYLTFKASWSQLVPESNFLYDRTGVYDSTSFL